MSIKSPKKLIEVALPLDDINEAAAREKSIRHGHPSTLHLWWARRPLAAARAVIFAQMVNDPGGERGYYAGKTKQQANHERERLFDIMRRLVKWENTNNESVLADARAEIMKSWRETCELNKGKPGFDPERLPGVHDPFAGGGAIPLEAHRLGLDTVASDLNPVAVLLNRAMIEFPARFPGKPPVGPVPRGGSLGRTTGWRGAQGLAEDVRRYGAWMREEAWKRIGHLYPNATLPKELGGTQATVIAWIWARTVRSPNPAFSAVEVPLVSSFVLSSKSNAEYYIEPVVDGDRYSFTIKAGAIPPSALNGTKAGSRGANFICILSGSPIDANYIRAEGKAGRIGQRLMAVVVDGPRGRTYLSPTQDMEDLARSAKPSWRPDVAFFQQALGFRVGNYGYQKWSDLFTDRQLVALGTYADLVREAREKIRADAVAAGWADDGVSLDEGGEGACAYADAVTVYLALALSRLTDICNALCRWENTKTQVRNLFGRQAISMLWDFAENNVFGEAAGDYLVSLTNLAKALDKMPANEAGAAVQADAQSQSLSTARVVSTDPPYYDNIGYADLSDFFYVWLRRSLRPVLPKLFSTMEVPKAEELVAGPRQGSRDAAERFFLEGMTSAMRRLAEQAHPAFPTTIYYAFKQSDTTEEGTISSGWVTFLAAVIQAGFSITGTWPMRTELGNRMRGAESNALGSSIVLVCRKRADDAAIISRKDFLRELREVLPGALEDMLNGGEGRAPIAPVDLSQAIIGPGMAVFSKYKAVLEADGAPMSVHTALTLINKFLDEGEDFDADTRFCLGWFQQYGWATGQFGTADVLARSKGTTVDHIAAAGVIESGGGKVRLLKIPEYPTSWDPSGDANMPVWEALHHLIKALSERGVEAAGGLAAKMPDRVDTVRQLAYRLYTFCERKGWAEDARAYNTIISSWSQVDEAAQLVGHRGTQITMDV